MRSAAICRRGSSTRSTAVAGTRISSDTRSSPSANAGQNPNPNGCLLIDGPRYGMVIWDHGAEEPQDHVRHRHVGYFLIKTTEMLIDLAQGQTHEPIIDSGKKKFDA